jgi:hypothetical protein
MHVVQHTAWFALLGYLIGAFSRAHVPVVRGATALHCKLCISAAAAGQQLQERLSVLPYYAKESLLLLCMM